MSDKILDKVPSENNLYNATYCPFCGHQKVRSSSQDPTIFCPYCQHVYVVVGLKKGQKRKKSGTTSLLMRNYIKSAVACG